MFPPIFGFLKLMVEVFIFLLLFARCTSLDFVGIGRWERLRWLGSTRHPTARGPTEHQGGKVPLNQQYLIFSDAKTKANEVGRKKINFY